MPKKKRFNIAYGSNLNLQQMAQRCPTAKVYGKGILKDYRLLFKGTPGNAHATIEAYKGGVVPVLVWEVLTEDEQALDVYEGFPNYYYKDNLVVELETGETMTAMVYIMADTIKDRIHLNMPSRSYLQTVMDGYCEARFDLTIIKDALNATDQTLVKETPGVL